jgi:phage/plasmid-associated DNA primase
MSNLLVSKRPFDIAEQFANEAWDGQFFVWRGSLWVWDKDNTSWKQMNKAKLKGDVAQWLSGKIIEKKDDEGEVLSRVKFNFSARFRDDVCSFISAYNILEEDPPPPFDAKTGERPIELQRCIMFKDVVVDVATMEVRPRTWRDFHTCVLPFNWDPEAKADLWDATCDVWFNKCEQAKELLNRENGYLLMGFRGFDRLFLHAGKPRAGKGCVDRIQGALLGEENRIALSLADMGDTFATQGLESAQQLVLSEYDEGKSSKGEGIRMRQLLKQIIGRDNIRVRSMYQGPQSLRSNAVPKIVGNAIPEIPDTAGGVWSKASVLWFGVTHLGNEDITLEPRLMEELPGIARRAVEAAHRLWNAKPKERWPVQPGAKRALEDAVAMSNPVEAWARTHCRIKPGSFSSKASLYKSYCNWCSDQGKPPMSSGAWSQAMKTSSMAPSESVRKIQDHDELRSIRVYTDIQLLDTPQVLD